MKLNEVKELKATGDCYPVSVRYMLDHSGSNLTLVHAEVTGQAHLEGIKYGHAWVEDGDEVIDLSNGRNIRMNKKLYYKIGKISTKKGKMFRYSFIEMARKLGSTKHYGPWDLKTER